MPPRYKKTFSKKTKTEFNKENAKWLVIVESPSKCAKIESYLGPDYKCIASKGHIRNIEGLKSIDTKKDYSVKFSILPEKRGHVHTMQSIISQFSKTQIILATDDDREGEAIAWHICDVFELPVDTTQRIIFHEITKTAIQNAVKTPKTVDMNLVKAQHARQVLDMLVGFKISPILWKYLYSDKENSLSAGRCQTPALRLVYDNEIERKNGKGVEYKYKILGNFFSKNIEFQLNKDFTKKEDVLQFMQKSIDFNYEIAIGSPKETINHSPNPFNTSNLLQTASNLLHLSPKDTMGYCQILYQDGHITYMRTESTKYSKDFLTEAKKYIQNKFGEKYIGTLNKLENHAGNPHEAIRATHIEQSNVSYTDKRIVSLYKLIWSNTVNSCMADAINDVVNVNITAPDDAMYTNKVEIPLFLGWKKNKEFGTANPISEQNTGKGLLLFFETVLKSKSPIVYNSIESIVSFYNKHSHYTESSLIKELENMGIGRPSTFSMLVDTIQERGYVKKTNIEGEKFSCLEYKLIGKKIEELKKEKIVGNEKNKLVIQPIGIIIVEFLTKHFDTMFSYDYTKQMEDKLDIISNGNEVWNVICSDCNTTIKTLIKPISKLSKEAYKLDEEHEVVFAKFGATIRTKNSSGEIEYKPIKKEVNIDFERLKNGNYKLDDLLDSTQRSLGKYQENEIMIKIGRYGNYLEWGETKKSLNDWDGNLNNIRLDEAIDFINGNGLRKPPNIKIVRVLNDSLIISNGKFGEYAFYKTANMTKPKFLNIKKFKEGFLTCEPHVIIDWLKEKYSIEI